MIGDKGGTAGGDTFSSENVILSPENGIITVRATSHQHEQIQEFLDSVIANAQRQVLIEATIVEVELSDQYQAGIDWNIIRGNFRGSVNRGQSNDAGEVTQLLENIFSSDNSPLTSLALTYASSGVSAMLKLLRNFGDLRVLSSPRLMVLNNHTAVLKVVENVVYFEVDAEPGSVGTFVGTGGGGQPSINNVAVDTTAKTVPVGLVMTVTPEINERDVVILNVRPTISSISRTVRDPNPLLSSIQNLVPQIQVREMESMLRINSGQTAILGGLIQDAVRKDTNSIPLLSEVPVVGDTVFKSRQTDYGKNELVIFLRPVVVHNASIQEDLRGYRSFLEDRRY